MDRDCKRGKKMSNSKISAFSSTTNMFVLSAIFLTYQLPKVNSLGMIFIWNLENDQGPSTTQEELLHVLKDRPSLLEKVTSPDWSPQVNTTDPNAQYHSITYQGNEFGCANAKEDIQKISEAIERAVSFYEGNVDKLTLLDSAVGLQVLQGVLEDKKLRLGENKNLLGRTSPLISQIVKQAVNAETLFVFKKQLQTMGEDKDIWKRSFSEWKSLSVIESRLNSFHTIGYEKETIWPTLNGQCQAALVSSCEVPYVCQRTFLDPEPQSQYMLTHQALYLHFAKKKSCDKVHPKLFERIEENLDMICGKIFQEAKLIAKNGFPLWARDLFAEQVGICGLAGYPNFLRKSWVQSILSWQSANSGCSIEIPIKNLTNSEKSIDVEDSDEKCIPHLTSTSLTTFALQFAHFLDRCPHLINVEETEASSVLH